MDWSRIPNLVTIGLLLCGFASLDRRSPTPSSRFWLLGWLTVLLHFIAAMFQDLPGFWGMLTFILGRALSVASAFLLLYAAIPDRRQASFHWMTGLLMAVTTLYIAIVRLAPGNHWLLNVAAALLGLCPLSVIFLSAHGANSIHRWILALIYCAASIFLLKFQFRMGNASVSCAYLDLQVIFFSSYFSCFVLVAYTFYRVTAGAFITIIGFFSWAIIIVLVPMIAMYLPHVHIENEVWDLPKFILAVGMLLILLEDQIEHNKHLAQHDVLTGLPNRRLFQDRLAHALERARRDKTLAAVLVIDLNGFKQVNDTFGHRIGDLLLQRAAAVFNARIRRSDTVARTGGDEFSIVLEAPTTREDAMRVAKELAHSLSVPLQLEAHTVRTSASIGVAIFPDDANDLESLCVLADHRMYEDKHGIPLIGTASPPFSGLARHQLGLAGASK